MQFVKEKEKKKKNETNGSKMTGILPSIANRPILLWLHIYREYEMLCVIVQSFVYLIGSRGGRTFSRVYVQLNLPIHEDSAAWEASNQEFMFSYLDCSYRFNF